MNWITNFVRPKLQAIVGKKEVPDNLWETCPKCSQMLLKRELENNFFLFANIVITILGSVLNKD